MVVVKTLAQDWLVYWLFVILTYFLSKGNEILQMKFYLPYWS